MKWVVASLMVLLVGVLVSPGRSLAADFPGRATNGPIAATTAKNNRFGVFTIEPDGSGFRIRVPGSAPAWSPDGSQLAYIAPNERIAIWTPTGIIKTGVKADGADVYTGARLDWSPDGTRLAFGHATEVWIMNVATPYEPTRLTRTACGDYSPSWSPDGQQIAYLVGCEQAIHVINADGTGDHAIANPLGLEEAYPEWSPDGATFAFLASADAGTGVWLMDADGSDQRFLTPTVEFCCGSPSWAPDASELVFVANGVVLNTISVDGSGLEPVPTPGIADFPDWGPAS